MVQRHRPPGAEPSDFKFEPRALTPAPPPVPGVPPGPFGDLSTASVKQITDVAGKAWRQSGISSPADRKRGTGMLLEYLAGFEGATWQDRWEASGLNERERPISELGGLGDPSRVLTVNRGLRSLFCLRVVRPSLEAFRTNWLKGYADTFRRLQQDPLLEEFFGIVEASAEGHLHKLTAKFDVTAALTVFGIALADLTPEALLHYGMESRRLHLTRGARPADGVIAGRQTWHFLHRMGHFPATVPATLRGAAIRGQRTVAEMVDRYGIRNTDVRDLLVGYITRRSTELDYATTDSLAWALAGLFWATIEKINPDQSDLRLSEATYEQWKAEIAVRGDGRPRKRPEAIKFTVRAFYLDLQSWAASEPERWARWAVPCPIRDAELRSHTVHRRRVSEHMAERTRQRQPLLPLLVDHVERRHADLQALLAAASAAPAGAEFTHAGRLFRRTNTDYDTRLAKFEGAARVRVTELATGRTFNVAAEEDRAFWEWAIVQTLRHSGIRAEELCELTYLSIRQYQRPNGEVVALLVIAPSKTDRERVIPMSAELFAVIAAIVRRHLRDQPTIPPVRRYDLHERVWSEPMPFLFQRRAGRGPSRTVMSYATVCRMLRLPCQALAKTHPQFTGLRFSTHDFRRIFATELVNNGLPIHIGAALLGHLSVQTTRGYVAVFDEDLVRHYQAFLERRRALRPPEEYRQPTDTEWTQFEEHFDKRKVELGTCGRPYGTPCSHEHACIRCPVLQVDPKMLARLDEIEADLIQRRRRAEHEGWLGEIEGLDLTLSFLREKRTHTRRFARRTQLGLPTPRPRPT